MNYCFSCHSLPVLALQANGRRSRCSGRADARKP
ncbi:MAG: hypothetical protein U5O39_19475 [Gammaproteobacteria bacterium]|nr:hypothetical protein [Gammaproteobacteria bacterium]